MSAAPTASSAPSAMNEPFISPCSGEQMYLGSGSDCRAQWTLPRSLMLFRAQLYTGLCHADSTTTCSTKNWATPTTQAKYPSRAKYLGRAM